MITFYELAAKDEALRFSPFAWRIRLALQLKGLNHEAVAWHFLGKEATAAANYDKSPVICDNSKWVGDSYDIACYLDDTYGGPLMFDGAGARHQGKWIDAMVGVKLLRPAFPLMAYQICNLLDEKEQDYFRTTREKMLRSTLEEAAVGREERVAQVHEGLRDFALLLKSTGSIFMDGAHPGWTDACVFGALMFMRCGSDLDIDPKDDILADWYNRMLDLHDGDARKAACGYKREMQLA